MNKPGPAHTLLRIFSTGWLIVRNLIGGLASVVMPTEQDLREAGVYRGEQRE
jgi:hypothetical protein